MGVLRSYGLIIKKPQDLTTVVKKRDPKIDTRRKRKHEVLTSTLYTGPISILTGHFSLMEFSSSDALLKDWNRRYISFSSVKENSLRPKQDWSHPGCFPSTHQGPCHITPRQIKDKRKSHQVSFSWWVCTETDMHNRPKLRYELTISVGHPFMHISMRKQLSCKTKVKIFYLMRIKFIRCPPRLTPRTNETQKSI